MAAATPRSKTEAGPGFQGQVWLLRYGTVVSGHCSTEKRLLPRCRVVLCRCAGHRWAVLLSVEGVCTVERDGTILTGCSCSHPTFFSHRNPTRKKVPCCVRQPLFYSPPVACHQEQSPQRQISERSQLRSGPGLLLATPPRDQTTLTSILAQDIPKTPPSCRGGCPFANRGHTQEPKVSPVPGTRQDHPWITLTDTSTAASIRTT